MQEYYRATFQEYEKILQAGSVRKERLSRPPSAPILSQGREASLQSHLAEN